MKRINALQKQFEIERTLTREHLKYRAELAKARASRDPKTIVKVVAKVGLFEKFSDLPPPVPPSVYFFPPPGQFPDPAPPPHDLVWVPDLRRIERMRKMQILGVVCGYKDTLSITDASYVVSEEGLEGKTESHELTGKSLNALATTVPSYEEEGSTLSLMLCGYSSTFTVPQADYDIDVTITSAINANFSWVETITYGTDDDWAYVFAQVGMGVTNGDQFVEACPRTIVCASTSDPDQPYLERGPVGEILDAKITVPREAPRDVEVGEWVLLYAENNSWHSLGRICGSFTWDPLAVDLFGNCHSIQAELGVFFPR